MALSLANMLARVKRIVPTTTLDTELQDALLERMNYLTTLDVFPFQEKHQSSTLAAGAYTLATPDNFAVMRTLKIFSADYERPLTFLDAQEFDSRFPNPNDLTSEEPRFYTIKVAEGEIHFNCPADIAYTVYMLFYAVPDDATDTTISQLSEMAKLTLIDWAASDGFRMLKDFDRASILEQNGDKKFMALKRRYQLSREVDARFISLKESYLERKAY